LEGRSRPARSSSQDKRPDQDLVAPLEPSFRFHRVANRREERQAARPVYISDHWWATAGRVFAHAAHGQGAVATADSGGAGPRSRRVRGDMYERANCSWAVEAEGAEAVFDEARGCGVIRSLHRHLGGTVGKWSHAIDPRRNAALRRPAGGETGAGKRSDKASISALFTEKAAGA